MSATRRTRAASTASASSGESVTSTAAASGSCSACETRSEATCSASARVVGEHGDLGGARLRVDADDALEQPLRGRDVDVAGAGDEAHRLAHVVTVVDAVRERGDRLRAAHRPHLVDAEQGARREDRRVRPAPVVGLRRARDGDAGHLGQLGRDDVHDDAARVDGQAAGHVEADAVDGHPPLGDRATLGTRVVASVRRWSAWTRRARRVDSSRAARTSGSRVARAASTTSAGTRGSAGRRRRSARPRRTGRGPPLADVRDDRAHGIQGGLDVERGTRQGGPQLTQGQPPTPQVDPCDDAGGAVPGEPCRRSSSPWTARMASTARARALIRRPGRSRGTMGRWPVPRRREVVQQGLTARRRTPFRAGVGGAPPPGRRSGKNTSSRWR